LLATPIAGSTSSKDVSSDLSSTLSGYNWKESINWSNHLYALTWNYMVSPKIFVNTIAHYSQYDYGSSNKSNFDLTATYDDYQNDYHSSIKDYELSTNVSWFCSHKYTLHGGIGCNMQNFVPGVNTIRLTNIEETDGNGQVVNLNVNKIIGDTSEFHFFVRNVKPV
jgi:hypothetical protein